MTDRNSTRPSHIAYHEAGHAVAHIRLRILQCIITIEPGPGTLGHAIAEGPDDVWDKSAAEDMVIAFLAGYAALVAAGYSHEAAMEGADDDMAQSEDLIESWGLQHDLPYWRERAVNLMQEPGNIAAVELIATHLMQRRTIDEHLASVLVDLSDGEATPAQFAAYLALREMQ